MVDLGISRTRDIQGPLPPNARQERALPEPRNRQPRVGAARSPRLAPPGKPAAPAPADLEAPDLEAPDLEADVRRLNETLGHSTIRFVLHRSTSDIRVDLVALVWLPWSVGSDSQARPLLELQQAQ